MPPLALELNNTNEESFSCQSCFALSICFHISSCFFNRYINSSILSPSAHLAVRRGYTDDLEEEGTRHFMVNVIQPQFNLHSEEANVSEPCSWHSMC